MLAKTLRDAGQIVEDAISIGVGVKSAGVEVEFSLLGNFAFGIFECELQICVARSRREVCEDGVDVFPDGGERSFARFVFLFCLEFFLYEVVGGLSCWQSCEEGTRQT